MKKFTLLTLLAIAVVFVADAQKSTAASKTKAVAKEAVDNGKTIKSKDRQNQEQFFQPDMKATDFNYYDRKKINSPQQPTYDLDSAVYQQGFKHREKQQEAYKKNKYYYPAMPRNQWELGVNLGMAMVSGDVKPYWQNPLQNFGIGFTVRKALGYVFSLRGGYNYFCMTGRNWEADENLKWNHALNGGLNPSLNYYAPHQVSYQKGGVTVNQTLSNFIVYNYRTIAHEMHLAVVGNIGNIKFHRERNIINLYALAGVSAFLYNTRYDQLDKNGNMYNYGPIFDLIENHQTSNYWPANETSIKGASQKYLKSIWDGKYESAAEQDQNLPGIKQWAFIPAFTVGAGIQFHVAKWFVLGIEERVILTSNDLLDGYRWQQNSWDGMTRDYDNISYTSVNFLFHVGKNRTEPLYWLNPMHQTYKKLGETNPDKIAADILKDTDEDGVPDKLDKEPATKKGCPVDVKGVALDSDKDGLADCDDKEPFSPAGCPIDQYGVANCPPPACCAEAANNSLKNANPSNKSGYDCSKIELPSAFFDDDKYYLSPEYYGNLHQVAERLQMCPDVKMVVTGYDESKGDQKYNEQLAYNRATSAVDYLTEKYGISRDRFIVKFEGKKKPTTPMSAQEMKKSRKVEFKYAADGDAGNGNPPAPHPGLKAGTNK